MRWLVRSHCCRYPVLGGRVGENEERGASVSAHLAMCAAYTCDHATHILDPINTIRTQTRQSKLIVINAS